MYFMLEIAKNVCENVGHKKYNGIVSESIVDVKFQKGEKSTGHSASRAGNPEKFKEYAGYIKL